VHHEYGRLTLDSWALVGVGDGRIPLDRALVSSYKLPIVTLLLSAAIGNNLQRDYLGVESVPRLRRTRFRGWEVVGGLN